MGNPIRHLTSLGADAMDNMYDVILRVPSGAIPDWPSDAPKIDTDGGIIITGRLSQFQVPSWKADTYDISYHGVSKKMPKSKINFERQITLDFRLDANYLWYKSWKALANCSASGQTGGVANYIPGIGKVDKDSLFDSDYDEGLVLEVRALKTSYLGTNNLGITSDGDGAIPDNDDAIKWIFKQFWAQECTEPTYKTDGGSALTFKVTGFFGDCDYPVSGEFGSGTGKGEANVSA